MRFARLSVLVLGLPFIALSQSEQKPDGIESFVNALTSNINIEGIETSFDPATGTATATGDVHIKYGDAELTANKAIYNTNTGDVNATGTVTIVKAGVTYQSEAMIYNVKTGEMSGELVRSSQANDVGTLLFSLHEMNSESHDADRIDAKDTFFTTHDLADPNYRVKAKRMTIYPNDRIVMHNVTVYAGKTPVFWLPYLSQPLDSQLGYRFSPGYSSTWGGYLLNEYGMIHGDHTLAEYKFDLRSIRGVAFGADFTSLKQRTANNDEWGKLKFYFASDNAPLTTRANEDRTGTPTDRYRINFQHRIYITGPAERTWYLDFDINKLSDQFIYEDFFYQEFRTDREPDNQVSLVRSDPRYTATLMAKFQLNDFYRTDTRLPELAFDFTRQPIFNSGFFYQGNTSYSMIKEHASSVETTTSATMVKDAQTFLADGTENQSLLTNKTATRLLLGLDPGSLLTNDEVTAALDLLRLQVNDSGFNRLHTYHEVLYPKTAFGWLTFVPRLGIGYQEYSSISGSTNKLTSASRGIYQAGLDVSFKSTKTWDDVQSATLGLDGLKHTVQPYINYSYLKADDIAGLPTIDRNVPTTRPRPLDIPFYTGIDSLRSWNVARVGVRNLLQTRRDYTSHSDDEEKSFRTANETVTQSYAWAGLNTYVDVFMDDPEFNRDVSNLYNELFWRPVPWLSFFADTQLPIGSSSANYTEANYGVTFLPTSTLSVTLGHQYIADHPFFPNSSLVYSRIYAKLNENWGVSMNHIYEMANGTLQYQSYSVHRDMSSWIASFGGLVRDNGTVKDYGLIFSLTLKEFPQVAIPLDTDPNPTGRGGAH